MDQMAPNHVSELQNICLEVISSNEYWIVQKRHIQYLPEHVANQLLQLLLLKGRVHSPSLLDTFRHALTQLTINVKQLKLQLGAEWIAYIAGLSHLQQLSLQHATRLKDKQLLPLNRLSASLTALDLSGCSNITNRACAQVIGSLTALQSLNLTGTGIRPPILVYLTQLTSLTHLNLGGCDVSDDDITRHITHFKLLQSLDLWGSSITDASVPYLNQLPALQQLSIAWSQIRSVIPLTNVITSLDLSHCQLDGSWHEADGLMAAAGAMKLQEFRVMHTHAPAAYGDVMEAILRSSSSSLCLLDFTGFSGCDLLPLLLALQPATALHSLSLSGTGLVDDYCPALTPCSALQNLDLSQNPGVTTAGLEMTLPALTGLRRLNLTVTGVKDECLGVLGQLPLLRELVLADTVVTWEAYSTGSNTAAAAAGTSDGADEQHVGSTNRLWQSLQVLDLLGGGVSDAGCVHLAKSFNRSIIRPAGHRPSRSTGVTCSGNAAAAAAVAVDDPMQQHPDAALRVLSVGSSSSSSHKISRKGLAALATITSLQHLTLQGCQIQDRDLRFLGSLHHLQQLHVNNTDPWLLSDEALSELPVSQQMDQLVSVTRDGRLLHTKALAASAAGEVPACEASTSTAQVVGLRGASALLQQQSWLQQDISSGSESAYLYSGEVTARSSSQHQAAAAQVGMSPQTVGSSRTKSASGAARSSAPAGPETVYRRLSEYDERYRYSRQQLMAIGGRSDEPAAVAVDSGGSLQQQEQQGHNVQQTALRPWVGLHCIPEDLRADRADRW